MVAKPEDVEAAQYACISSTSFLCRIETQDFRVDRHHEFVSTVSLAGNRFDAPLAGLVLVWAVPVLLGERAMCRLDVGT